jgi:hypothetical protein
VRVARETYVLLARFRDDTAKRKKGEPPGSPFFLSTKDLGWVLRSRSVTVMMMLAVAVMTVMAVMRRRRVVGLGF